MTRWIVGMWLGLLPALVQTPSTQSPGEAVAVEAYNSALRARLESAPELPFEPVALDVRPRPHGWQLGMVSWMAADPDGLTYLLQRGDKADPVVVIDKSGTVVRSWGKDLFTMPHAIRLDPQGNVWTTDAASSRVYKFSPEGRLLLTIEVGGQPTPCGRFCSTTDIAFAPNGHLYVTDGYRNARVLEYTPDGTKVREWGRAGTGPGEFRLPHSIQIDEKGVVYVADRENGRIQRFDLRGTYLGEWAQYGKTFGLKLVDNVLWLSSGPRGPNVDVGWLIKVDRDTGRLLGYVNVGVNHGLDVLPNGDLLSGPGPGNVPQRFRARRRILQHRQCRLADRCVREK